MGRRTLKKVTDNKIPDPDDHSSRIISYYTKLLFIQGKDELHNRSAVGYAA